MKISWEQIYHLILLIAVGIASSIITHRCDSDRHKQQQNKVIKVERDTVIQYDTIPQYYPKPVEVERVRTEYQWLTRVEYLADTSKMIVNDSVLVEVPITSKHYHGNEYDAWVSGYQPSLDSINVYQRTEYITETITRTAVDQKHFFLDIAGGCEYFPNAKNATPFAELGLSFKKGRFGIGAYGGYSHDFNDNKATPYAKAKITYGIFSF